MVDLAELQKLHLAHALIQAGLRLSIVRGLTRIGTRTLRQWWKDIHGAKPSNGKLPESVLSFIKDKDSAVKLSAFVAVYKRLNYGIVISPENLLATWREFLRICGTIDINAAYFAVRDVKVGIVVFSRCDQCNAGFIYDAGSRYTDRCPFCGTKIVD
jgi:hypothetical protein